MWCPKIILCVFLVTCFSACSSGNPNKIVNGTNAREGEIPYIVSVRQYSMHQCGGSIIAPKWVLTAAHCIAKPFLVNFHEKSWSDTFSILMEHAKPIGYSILYGTIRLHYLQEPTKYTMPVIYIRKHENFAEGSTDDIALLELQADLPFNARVRPIPLAKFSEATPHGSSALVAGWGRPYTGGSLMHTLQRANIVVFSEESCRKIYHTEVNPLVHICAGIPEGGRGVCNSDSGGPLVVNGIQLGIVSWARGLCGRNPAIFVRVSAYRKWIHRHSGV